MKPDEIEELVADSIKQIDFSEEARQKHRASVNAERAAFGLRPLDIYDPNDPPDVPSCDSCGKEFAGTLTCSGCRCASYCSKECQKLGWKSQHKVACKDMADSAKLAGEEVVKQLVDTTISPILRVQNLERLDGSAAYKAAKKAGLYDALVSLLRDDSLEVARARFLGQDPYQNVLYCNWIMMTVFRGHRVLERTSIRVCDGGRIQSFVYSSQDAWWLWLDACITAALLPLDEELYQMGRQFHAQVHDLARDVWAGLSMVFTNDRASKAILLGKTSFHEDSVERIIKLATKYKAVLGALHKAKPNRDLRDVVEGYAMQVAAMISYRCREYELPVDFCDLLEMTKVKQQMYQQIAVPLGEATIRKGSSLNNQEAGQAMAEARRKPNQGGKKKSGKRK